MDRVKYPVKPWLLPKAITDHKAIIQIKESEINQFVQSKTHNQ